MLKPDSTIGILGGGQLGRMLALAAAQLGFKCHVFAPNPDAPAFDVVHRVTMADYTDTGALDRFATDVDVITYEFENIPAETAMFLAARKPVVPDPARAGHHPGPRRREGIRGRPRHSGHAVRARRFQRRHSGRARADRPAGGAEDPPLRL